MKHKLFLRLKFVFILCYCFFTFNAYGAIITAMLPEDSQEAIDFHISVSDIFGFDYEGSISMEDLNNTISNNLAIATDPDGNTRQLNLTGGFLGNDQHIFSPSDPFNGQDGISGNTIGIEFNSTPLQPGETITIDFPGISAEELGDIFSFTFDNEIDALVLNSTLFLDNPPLVISGFIDDNIVIKYIDDSIVIFGVSEPTPLALFVLCLAGFGFTRKLNGVSQNTCNNRTLT